MPDFEDEFQFRRYDWPIIFVVDTSGSMAGLRLTQLNAALQELNFMLETLADQNEVRLSIRLIEFNTTARWRVGNLESGVEHLDVYFSEATGMTNTAEALRLASGVMTRRYIMLPSLKPIIILITDGYSVDPQETIEAIDELKTCALGHRDKILRVAFTIGEEQIPELETYASQVDDKSLVFQVDDLGHIQETDLLRNIITSFCFSYAHDRVSPYDDDEPIIIPDDPDWEDDWEE